MIQKRWERCSGRGENRGAEVRKQKATACFRNRWKNIAPQHSGERFKTAAANLLKQNTCSECMCIPIQQHHHSIAKHVGPSKKCVCVCVCVSIAWQGYIRTGNNISWALVSWLFFRRHVSNIIQQWKPSLSNALIWWHNGFFDVKSNILIGMLHLSFAFMCSFAVWLCCYFDALNLLIRQFFRILAVFCCCCVLLFLARELSISISI